MGHFPDFICRMKAMAYAKREVLRVLTSSAQPDPPLRLVIPNRAEGPVRNLLFVWSGNGSREVLLRLHHGK
jgi:hypothetical protein